MKTLRARLLRTLAAMLTAIFIALWLLLTVGIRHVSERQMAMHLDHDAGAVLAGVSFDAAGGARLDPRAVEPVYEVAGSGHYFVLRVDGRELQRSPSSDGVALPPPEDGEDGAYRLPGPQGQSLLVVARSEHIDGHEVTLLLAEDASDTWRELLRLSAWALLLFLLLLGAALLLQGLAVRRALVPLDEVRLRLRELGAGRSSRLQGEVPLEIQPLVQELNRLLQLLERRMHQSRTALGNLAHALKTPLAVVVRLAEDPACPPALAQQLQQHAGTIRGRIERELRRARLAGPQAAAAGQLFDPAEELPALAQVLGSVYRGRQLHIAVDAAPGLLPLDREDMLEAAGNLADNACKWARTQVRIEARVVPHGDGGQALRLRIADDGPGCPPGQAEAILARGVRLDESVAGHGLGLAIVRELAQAYGGSLVLGRDAQLGGMAAELLLPLPAAGPAV